MTHCSGVYHLLIFTLSGRISTYKEDALGKKMFAGEISSQHLLINSKYGDSHGEKQQTLTAEIVVSSKDCVFLFPNDRRRHVYSVIGKIADRD